VKLSPSLTLGAVALLSLAAGMILYQFWITPPASTGQADSKAVRLDSIPLVGLDGEQTLFSDWQGDVLVVNFWAPWCAPCRREIPVLTRLQQDYAERGLKVLGIAFDGREPVSQFAEEYAINYPLFLAGNQISMYNAALDNPSGSLPYTVILDRDLAMRFQHNGEVTEAQLADALKHLL
jgi:thiol-disulfide isomerase/thioredoxin